MYTVSISSYKGGTGKTTTAVNLSYDLSARGYKVLLIDADPQANATYMFSQVNENSRNLADFFATGKILSCIRRTRYAGLDIIKGSSRLEEANGDPLLLRKQLEKLNGRYDFCIIDCHPSMQLPTIAAIAASSLLIVPFKPDGYGKMGLVILEDYFRQIRHELDGCPEFRILITQYAGRKSQAKAVTQLIEDYDYPVFSTVIRASEAVNTSIAARKPLKPHRAKATVTADYLDLTEEFLTAVSAQQEEGRVCYG